MIDAQRELIAAYHDGELGAGAMLEARRLIETDPEAARYLETLERLDKSLRQVFDPILNEPVPLAIQSVVHRQRRLDVWIPVALAASLALVAVLIVRQAGVDRELNDQLTQMQLQIAQLRNQTLENVPSGRKASWSAPAGKTTARPNCWKMPLTIAATTDFPAKPNRLTNPPESIWSNMPDKMIWT